MIADALHRLRDVFDLIEQMECADSWNCDPRFQQTRCARCLIKAARPDLDAVLATVPGEDDLLGRLQVKHCQSHAASSAICDLGTKGCPRRHFATVPGDGPEPMLNALRKIRAHTSYFNPTPELLRGLLSSIERIADEALLVAAEGRAPEPLDDGLTAEGRMFDEGYKAGYAAAVEARAPHEPPAMISIEHVKVAIEEVAAQANLCAGHIGAAERQRDWLRSEVRAVAQGELAKLKILAAQEARPAPPLDSLRDVIRWALGEHPTDEFPGLPADWPKRKFYWREQLRARWMKADPPAAVPQADKE